jgi:hypothetical protein
MNMKMKLTSLTMSATVIAGLVFTLDAYGKKLHAVLDDSATPNTIDTWRLCSTNDTIYAAAIGYTDSGTVTCIAQTWQTGTTGTHPSCPSSSWKHKAQVYSGPDSHCLSNFSTGWTAQQYCEKTLSAKLPTGFCQNVTFGAYSQGEL